MFSFNLRFLRAIPRPAKFLYFFDLKTGAEFTLNMTILNKAFGVYGVGAMIVGASISPSQISMFLFSLLSFTAYALLYNRITHADPLSTLLFAYLYALDSLTNSIYTLLFGLNWFLGVEGISHLAAHQNAPLSTGQDVDNVSAGIPKSAGGNLSSAGVVPGETAVTTPLILQPEALPAILTLSLLWAFRLYTLLIVFAYARHVVRESATPGEAPFTGRNNGEGLRGAVGRALIGINRGYWVGKGWSVVEHKKRGRGRKASTAGRNAPPRGLALREDRRGLLNGV